MEKRFIFTAAVCLLFVAIWTVWLAPLNPENREKPKDVPASQSSRPTTDSSPTSGPAARTETSGPTGVAPVRVLSPQGAMPRRFVLKSDTLRYSVTTAGAAVESGLLENFAARAPEKGEDKSKIPPLEFLTTAPDRPNALALVDDYQPNLKLETAEWQTDGPEKGDTEIKFWIDVAEHSSEYRLTKTIRMLPNNHRVAVELSFEHLRGEALTKRYWLTTSSGLVAAEHKAQHMFHSLIGQKTEKGLELTAYTSKAVLDEEKSLHDIPQSSVRFACDMGIYFGAYLRVDGAAKLDAARIRAFAGTDHNSAGSYTQLAYLFSSDGPGTKKNIAFDYYTGPKDHRRVRESVGEGDQREDYLAVANYELKGQSCSCYSWPIIGSIVDGVSKLVLVSVSFFGSKFGNMGIAIMLLVFCLRLVLFPVNRYSQAAIQKQAEAMNRLKPKLDAIKEKYKDEPQKFAQEQMKLMKAEGVGFVPVKGCLPMLFQMPIFFGLLTAISFDIDLRHAPFLWCIDLSQPDNLLKLSSPFSVPCCLPGANPTISGLNVFPILMTLAWFFDTKTSMVKSSDPQMEQQQKMMMYMPIVFGLLMYGNAAGLSLYWLTNSLLAIIEKRVTKKFFPVKTTTPPTKTITTK